MNGRDALRMLAQARITLGVAAMLAPRRVVRMFYGPAADRAEVGAMARGFGAREVAVGLATLWGLETGQPVARWAWLNVTCDGTDALATVLAYRHLPRWRRFGTLVSALGAAALGTRIAQEG